MTLLLQEDGTERELLIAAVKREALEREVAASREYRVALSQLHTQVRDARNEVAKLQALLTPLGAAADASAHDAEQVRAGTRMQRRHRCLRRQHLLTHAVRTSVLVAHS